MYMMGIILLYTLYGMFIIAVYNNKVDRASPFVYLEGKFAICEILVYLK